MRSSRTRVLIIVQNLPVPLDRRVWLECQALVASGYSVSVICPKGPGDPAFEELDGVRIYKYAPPPQAHGLLGYLVEFVYCWLRTAALSVTVLRRDGFDVIQACNPPDTYWLLARFYRVLGKRFVFDQHDLNPEVFLSRFGKPRSLPARAQFGILKRLERASYAAADHVIATNESYRHTAMTRGELHGDDVTVVRSGPNTAVMRPVASRPELLKGKRHLAVYLGIMGPQDGVDLLLEAMATMVHDVGRTDCHLALLGFGDCLEELKVQAHELGLDDYVTFTGRADRRMIAVYLSTASIALCPDPLSPLNDVSTMNKTMEYMAYALPVVSFDLKETRVSAGDAAVYVTPNDVDAYAKCLDELLGDDERRTEMSKEARRRVAAELDWAPQAARYVEVYDRVLGRETPVDERPAWPEVDRRSGVATGPLLDEWGNELVDLRDAAELERFLRSRHLPAGPDTAADGHLGQNGSSMSAHGGAARTGSVPLQGGYVPLDDIDELDEGAA